MRRRLVYARAAWVGFIDETTDNALHRELEAILEPWRRSGRSEVLFRKWLRFRAGL